MAELTAARPARPEPGPPARPEVALLGSGRLRDALATVLAGAAAPVVAVPSAATAVLVVVTDGWDSSGDAAARAAAAGRPWLPVGTELGRAVIGPIEHAGRPGCVECARRRRRQAREHRAGYEAVLDRHGPALAGPAPWLTGLAAATVAALAAHEALAAVPESGPAAGPRTRGGILLVDLADLGVTDHRFLPDPACPVCGGLAADSAAAARLRPRSRPKRALDEYRVRPVDSDRLLRTYLDPEVGLVRALGHRTEAGLPVARAPLCLPGDGHEESGWGRAGDSRTARQVALLEALERYGGAAPGGRRTAVRAAYPQVADDAVDPRSFGLHPPQQHSEPGHHFGPYDEDEPRRWVWAHSFGRGRPVLVPESLGYYRTRLLHPEDPPLAYEVSNGCALGGCLEEAMLYGLLEVAERDAFLLTWHARLPAPRIDLAAWPDPLARLLAAEIERENGYLVHAFDITPEHGIPCVWALAVDPRGGSADRPATASAAGAHLDPRQAVLSALAELGPILSHLVRSYPEQAGRAAEMVADPSRVTEMADHALLHGHPDALERFDFLLRPPAGTPRPRRPDPPRPRDDLRDDLLGAVARFAAAGLDVLVLDQTAPEHRAGGLACVKVLVPGTLPMTFGHAHRRLSGLPRLHTVPRLLGHTDRPLGAAGVRTLPHPFP